MHRRRRARGADGGAAPTPTDARRSAARELADPRLQLGLLLRIGLAGLLSVPFWHAPALVYWGAQGWAKSLFFSTVAIWRNKGAFAVYGLGWIGARGCCLLAMVSVGVGLSAPQRCHARRARR